MIDKVIVTNRTALRSKYGAKGLTAINRAVSALVAADARRGLVTRVIDLSSAATGKRFKARVTQPLDARQNKDTIDAIFNAIRPAYLMLLGSIDVIPHQDLRNPVYVDDKEDDPRAWGDLPYACDAPYSKDVADFVGPTRVVSRLPDLTGADDPAHLLRLLQTAAAAKPRPLKDYLGYFALSVRLWRRSTAQSLESIFGNDDTLLLAPPTTPAQARSRLSALTHFINCHGGLADPQFYGEFRGKMPIALDTITTRRRIRRGTVAAVECCYGGELYDAVALDLDEPICQSYLAQGAYGYFGSTTIAYGPASGNGAADLITQYFLLEVHKGASIGHAALEARQQYVRQASEMDPIDLKTLAQFCLYGDPSVRPVKIPTPTCVPRGTSEAEAQRIARCDSRAQARTVGEVLARTKPTASKPAPRARPSPAVTHALERIAREVGLPAKAGFTTYVVTGAVAVGKRALAKRAPTSDRYHVLVAPKPGWSKADIGSRVAIVAKEADSKVVAYRVYVQR